MGNILRSQQLSEQQASSSTSTRNRIVAASMIDALEERKYAMSQQDLGSIAKKYDLDVDTLENVARTVMSPSILEGSRRTIVDEKNGEERVTMTVSCILLNVLPLSKFTTCSKGHLDGES